MFKPNIKYTQEYRGYKIMANEQLKCNKKILDTVINQIETSTAKHNKVFVVNFSLTYPQTQISSTNNKDITIFMDRFTKYLEKDKKIIDYTWVREQNTSKNHHYHVMPTLNGNKIQNQHGIMKEATRIWEEVISSEASGLVDYSSTPHMLRKDDPAYQEKLENCILHASYLAKENTKGNNPKRVRSYGCSR
ncbi:YagK/YfjJ domain-containing protein [Desulfovibrio litoralis]|uniref:YagK/YfjJ C-terminal domain-containing protein n=1 Tax=Desulfovibrio litoralis DSM 11393 TaxID=1121455 RepID=A0A1M7TPT6_9BACT|nr:inovirus-type Gp2 protein [Desulfovibrio litoralis]SHN72752.1 Protein of unknown function [Desulfovibrio litoralis DSM 11393]